MGTSDPRIVRFSCPRHNAFAAKQAPAKSRGSDGSFLPPNEPRLLPRQRFLRHGAGGPAAKRCLTLVILSPPSFWRTKDLSVRSVPPRVGFSRGVFRPVVLPRGAFDFLRWPLVLSFPSFSSLARLSSGVGEMLVSPESCGIVECSLTSGSGNQHQILLRDGQVAGSPIG